MDNIVMALERKTVHETRCVGTSGLTSAVMNVPLYLVICLCSLTSVNVCRLFFPRFFRFLWMCCSPLPMICAFHLISLKSPQHLRCSAD